MPFIITDQLKELCAELSGTSVACVVRCNGESFRENILFTHRGLSGPAILQISSFWQLGDAVEIDLLPDRDALEWLQEQQAARPDSELQTVLGEVFTKKMAALLAERWFASQADEAVHRRPSCATIADTLGAWQVVPAGTEGYRTAEVTLGGVDTREVSSKTMESRQEPRPLLHRRGPRRHRPPGRLQLPVGLGLGARGGAGRLSLSAPCGRASVSENILSASVSSSASSRPEASRSSAQALGRELRRDLGAHLLAGAKWISRLSARMFTVICRLARSRISIHSRSRS